MRVVVVGAGLGGLCVAHGLHKAGVDVEVLEAREGIHDPDELPAPGTPAAELVRFAENRTASWDSRATSVLREAIVADCFLTSLRSMTEIPDQEPSHA